MSRLSERLKTVPRRRWVLAGVNVLLALASAVCVLLLWHVTSTLQTPTAAQRFRGESDMRFAQLAAYLPVGQGKSEEDVFSFRSALESKFVEQSLQAPENGSLYLDAYCGRANVTITTDQGSAAVTAFGVGGDFFHFHPLTLKSGAYIAQRDLMDDLVVLDESLAWRLYGGMDLTGLTVTINGVPFVVSGVVEMESDFASAQANPQAGGLFLSWSALKKLREDLTVECYEVVLPDPITGYARGVVEELFPVGEGELVENSSRYSLSHLWDVARGFGRRSMRVNAVLYPYWENALRLTEDYASLLLVLAVLFALGPVVTALVLVIVGVRGGYRYVKRAVPEKISAAVEKHREHLHDLELERQEGE